MKSAISVIRMLPGMGIALDVVGENLDLIGHVSKHSRTYVRIAGSRSRIRSHPSVQWTDGFTLQRRLNSIRCEMSSLKTLISWPPRLGQAFFLLVGNRKIQCQELSQ